MIIEAQSAGFPDVQRVSKLVFGNQDRLIVAAAVADAEPGSIFARSLAQSIGIPDNRISLQLRQLADADLLVALPKVGGGNRIYFERRNSAFWELCVQLCQEV